MLYRELLFLDRIFKYLREAIHKDIAFPQLTIFIMVANNQGITHAELAAKLKVPQGTVSRNVIKLGDHVVQDTKGIWKQVGYELVETRPDPEEPRRYQCFLTKKGVTISKELSKLIGEGVVKLHGKNTN